MPVVLFHDGNSTLRKVALYRKALLFLFLSIFAFGSFPKITPQNKQNKKARRAGARKAPHTGRKVQQKYQTGSREPAEAAEGELRGCGAAELRSGEDAEEEAEMVEEEEGPAA